MPRKTPFIYIGVRDIVYWMFDRMAKQSKLDKSDFLLECLEAYRRKTKGEYGETINKSK